MVEVAAGVAIATSLLQARQTMAAGKQQETESKLQAEQEELAAIQRESDRKRRLQESLSAQIATAGARGIAAFEGSPFTVLQESIEAEERATERDVFQSRLAALTQRTRGEVARKRATAESLIGLGADITQVARTL